MQGNPKAKQGKGNNFLQIYARPFQKTTRNVEKVIKGKRAWQALFTLYSLSVGDWHFLYFYSIFKNNSLDKCV